MTNQPMLSAEDPLKEALSKAIIAGVNRFTEVCGRFPQNEALKEKFQKDFGMTPGSEPQIIAEAQAILRDNLPVFTKLITLDEAEEWCRQLEKLETSAGAYLAGSFSRGAATSLHESWREQMERALNLLLRTPQEELQFLIESGREAEAAEMRRAYPDLLPE